MEYSVLKFLSGFVEARETFLAWLLLFFHEVPRGETPAYLAQEEDLYTSNFWRSFEPSVHLAIVFKMLDRAAFLVPERKVVDFLATQVEQGRGHLFEKTKTKQKGPRRQPSLRSVTAAMNAAPVADAERAWADAALAKDV